MSTAASIEFTGMSFNAALDYYQLRSDVTYTKYPFATEGHPTRDRLLAYRFRAYESIYKAAYRDWETDRKSTRLNSSHITRSRMPSSA